MFKKILLSLLLLFALLVGFVAIGIYLDSMAEQQATGFCDAIPLATPIDVAHFKQTLLHAQPAMILGRDEIDNLRFNINARRDVITEQKIAASGIDEFLNKAGIKSAEEDKQASILVWFLGSFPYSGYVCEIRLAQQRVSSKRVVAID